MKFTQSDSTQPRLSSTSLRVRLGAAAGIGAGLLTGAVIGTFGIAAAVVAAGAAVAVYAKTK